MEPLTVGKRVLERVAGDPKFSGTHERGPDGFLMAYGTPVAAARQSLADPDWFLKVRLGRGSEVRRCEFTNYCEALDQQHKQVTCKLWDREQLDETDVTLATDGKRRLLAPKWRP